MPFTATLLADFASQARKIAARYAIASVHINYDPENDGGPFCCHYKLLNGPRRLTSPAGFTPEDALENLETCFWQHYHDSLRQITSLTVSLH